jgi:hypothetical protein
MSLYLKLAASVCVLVLGLAWLNAHPFHGDPFPNRPVQAVEHRDDLVRWNGWW